MREGTSPRLLRCDNSRVSKDIGGMTFAEQYRSLAAQFMARARSEQNPKLRSEWDFLAVCYMRLADQAERNGQTDVVYEPPLTDSNVDKQA